MVTLYQVKNFSYRPFFSIRKYLFKQNFAWIVWWRVVLVKNNFAYETYREKIGM